MQKAHDEHVNVLGHDHVDGVHVLAETIDDAPRGGHVKEVHGALQDVGQKGCVQPTRRVAGPQCAQQGGPKDEEACENRK